MSKIFHIGIPKSGTTSIQAVLSNDDRIALTRSTFFTTSSWWLNEEEPLVDHKVNIESNETLISGGYSKVKLNEVFARLSKMHPNAKIIVTIRKQQDAILSMFKYHIKHNFRGVSSLENWMYGTNLGIDYLSVCMYGSIAELLLLYFKKENIHFMFFEDLKTNPKNFYGNFYDIIGLDYIEEKEPEKKNSISLSDGQLYTLMKLNRLSVYKNDSEGGVTSSRLRSFEKKVKLKLVKFFNLTCPGSFFQLDKVNGFNKLMKEFSETNNRLVNLDFVEESKLKSHNYNL